MWNEEKSVKLQDDYPELIPDFLRMVSKCNRCTLFDRCRRISDLTISGKKLVHCFRIDIYPQKSDIDAIIKLLNIETQVVMNL